MAEELEQINEEEKQTKRGRQKTQKVFPRIIGGNCEYCGISAKECEHYKDIFYQGQFRCLCGWSNFPSTFQQSIYLYVPELNAWICNSEGCRKQVELRGLYNKPEILKFFMP